MDQRKKMILHVIVTILIMLFIFWQSEMAAEVSTQESDFFVLRLAEALHLNEDQVTFVVRKGAHLMEYLVLGISLFLTVKDFRKRASVLLPWLIGAAYAVTDEVHQYFVPGRSCEVRDMVIDACGVLIGVVILFFIQGQNKT